MKRIAVAVVLTIALFSAIACSQEKDTTLAGKAKSTDTKDGSPLVTFVEIGSVKCIPCKKMQPIMKEIEQEYAGKVKVVFYDVWTDEGKPYGKQYGIRVIPTQVFLDKDGKEYFRHEGYFPKSELVKVLKQKGV
ncbi:MAG: thioredoxin family protein [Candidatus Krumholzibacteria bacterium]|nr:thioredoxin family protein [Candidatus Krumholzibacteria bacterium]